jgi:hypothetical protein
VPKGDFRETRWWIHRGGLTMIRPFERGPDPPPEIDSSRRVMDAMLKLERSLQVDADIKFAEGQRKRKRVTWTMLTPEPDGVGSWLSFVY